MESMKRNMILEGVTVIDLCRHIAGPYCAQMLGDMGAEVIKVESLRGDDTRVEEPRYDGASLFFMNYNRNKKSIAVDLRSETGKGIFARLVERSDVLIQNYRPGVMTSMGFPNERLMQLNPLLIYLSVSGFGSKGPYANRAAFDEVLQAMSGLMAITGQVDGMPTLVGQPIVDILTGTLAFAATLLGLRQRDMTGEGQQIEVNLYGCALQAVNPSITRYLTTGSEDERNGNRNRYEAGINTYATRDGYVHLVAYANAHWAALANRIRGPELASDPRYATIEERAKHMNEIDDMIGGWMANYTTQEVIDMMVEDGVPCGPVRSIPEVSMDPELRQANRLVDVPSPHGNPVPLLNLPIDVAETPPSVRRPPPLLGEHTMEIACDFLGYPRSTVEQWCAEGTVAESPHVTPAPITQES
jgi:CoA:oxalate CoA-transferase